MLKGIFETTSICPFTNMCESYQTIGRSEKWMSKALSQMRRKGLDSLPINEGGYTAIMLEKKLGQMNHIKDRCYRHNKRCLKYWQYTKNQDSTIANMELQSNISILSQLSTLPGT